MDPWYLENLVCPVDRGNLRFDGEVLLCDRAHRYPVVDGVPVMLVAGQRMTIGLANESLRVASEWIKGRRPADPWFLDTLGIVDAERRGILALAATGQTVVDPVVSFLVGATNGIAYKELIGKLTSYPIPRLRLPAGDGKTLLDVGCSWGRWCLAAAQLGYRPVGVDPSLGAIMAARRVTAQQGIDARFVVGDARFLPFRDQSIDQVFSYSVLQHFSYEDAAEAVASIGRVLPAGGRSMIQMPTPWGLRCLYHQMRRQFREPVNFEVRYWSVPRLKRLFASLIGPTTVDVDCFFGIGLQAADLSLMPWKNKVAIVASECLRLTSRLVSPITYLADSVYVHSTRSPKL
jgi:SAM-dependent methyltransferase